MFNYNKPHAIVTGTTFSDNVAVLNGGGMANHASSRPRVRFSEFTGNVAQLDGGGIFSVDSKPAVADSFFCDNTPNHIVGDFIDRPGNELCP